MVTVLYNLTFKLVLLPQERKMINVMSFSQRYLQEIYMNTDTVWVHLAFVPSKAVRTATKNRTKWICVTKIVNTVSVEWSPTTFAEVFSNIDELVRRVCNIICGFPKCFWQAHLGKRNSLVTDKYLTERQETKAEKEIKPCSRYCS